jgi:preprotein translocase SecE subunit
MATKRVPRIRKVETVRERNEKLSQRADQDKKGLFSKVRTLLGVIFSPFLFVARPLKPLIKPLRFIGRILVPRYFRNSYNELRLVTWPSRRETWKLTLAVILFALVFGSLIALTDYGLDKVIRRIVLR